jgi:hypothetical protein
LHVDYYEDTPWPGTEDQTPSTPPSSPPYKGDFFPTLNCPVADHINDAEDEDMACFHKLDFLRRHSISSLLTPDCLSSAPPSECEERQSESEPESFDGITVLLNSLNDLQDEFDDFITDFDALLRAPKSSGSRYIVSQLPKASGVEKADQGGDEEAGPDSAVAVAALAGEADDEDLPKEENDGAANVNKFAKVGIEETRNKGVLESVEEHDSVELAAQVAFGVMLAMVWLAG